MRMGKNMTAQELLAMNCKRLADDKGLNQPGAAKIAARSGYKANQTTFGRAWKETGNATASTLDAVAAAFSVPVWKLFLPENVTQLPRSAPPKALAIADLIATLNDDGLTALLAQAKFIAAQQEYTKVLDSEIPK